ncbi:MAG TPA: GGDEF domain-containing protein [Epsilonproteobacteria bacterium]|nr:GGDEF domain-containing protein [Campylobacterota bacterium]
MRKDDALNVLTTVYDQIREHITVQDNEVNENDLINFLHLTAKELINVNFSSTLPTSISEGEAYKLLAKESIDSYATTSENFRNIASEAKLVDIDSLNDAFKGIQEQLDSEVERANETITSLIERVKHLEVKSNLDPLTKIYNRRAMEHYFETVLEPGRPLQNFAIMMIDIDDFKKINDTHGHQAGDKVLIFLARLLKRTLREGDKVFRYGGEEFLVTLNRINPEVCHKISDRILSLVRENTLLYKDVQLSITLSIGATMYDDGDTKEALIDRADKALYRAKHNGKDRIEVEK